MSTMVYLREEKLEKLSQEEIISSTKLVIQGLEALRSEHNSILHSLLETIRCLKREEEASLVHEKASLLRKSVEMIELGLGEAQVGPGGGGGTVGGRGLCVVCFCWGRGAVLLCGVGWGWSLFLGGHFRGGGPTPPVVCSPPGGGEGGGGSVHEGQKTLSLPPVPTNQACEISMRGRVRKDQLPPPPPPQTRENKPTHPPPPVGGPAPRRVQYTTPVGVN